MNDLEQQLRATFASRAAARPGPADLADQVIARGRAVRRRRLAAVATSGVLAVVLLVSVTLIRFGPDVNPTPGNPAAGGEPPSPAADPTTMHIGEPVRLAVFGPHSLRLPDGTEKTVNNDPDETIREVVRTASGWVVRSSSHDRVLSLATLVRDDESTTKLGDAVLSMAVNAAGDRIAVQSEDRDSQRVDVIEALSGQPVAATSLPGDVYSAPIVTRWSGDLVVLSAPNGDASPVATDVWNPTKGPYRSSMSGERLILGPAAEPGQLLALEPDEELPNSCLTWVDPTKAFTVLARKCRTGLRFGDGSLRTSPDGLRVISIGSTVHALDVRTMTSSRLALPGNALPWAAAWEDPVTVLFQLPGSVVRCRLDATPCELAPTPQVDGGAPLGFVG